MIEIFDRQTRRRTAICENAHAIHEQQKLNALWYLDFSLPCDDPKNSFCRPFQLVRNGGELYRIMPSSLQVDETGAIAYQCEHVLATLIDNILFGYHLVGNLGVYTPDVIRYILSKQLVKNWVLDECDFNRQFEYGWEQESLLSALFSVATPLSEPYIWRTNTAVYPWRVSLKRLDTEGRPELYIRRRHNMTSYGRSSDPQQIVTRLYPLGYGEGVNQLGISDVNGGVPYLQSPQNVVDKYGIIERAWVDRRYEDAESLKAAGAAMLKELQEPLLSYEVGFQELDVSGYDQAAVGKRVRLLFPELGESVDTFVTEVSRDYDDVIRSSITVANRSTDIAASVADLADRQRIEQTYAQGATQIYSQALQANCSSTSGLVMDFFIPTEMRIVNKVLCKIRMRRFRAYSKATESSEQRTETTTEGASRVITSTVSAQRSYTSTASAGASYTSSDGGSYSGTSLAGGGVTTTVTGGVDVSWVVANTISGATANAGAETGHYHSFRQVSSHAHDLVLQAHSHSFSTPSHSHSFYIGGHSHDVTIPSHSHDVTVPSHSHNVTIPSHAHQITPGIYEFGNAKSFALYVNDSRKANYVGSTAELDITSYLLGSDKKIPRGSWLTLEVRPDDLAYISIDLIIQGFIQSRGDNTV